MPSKIDNIFLHKQNSFNILTPPPTIFTPVMIDINIVSFGYFRKRNHIMPTVLLYSANEYIIFDFKNSDFKNIRFVIVKPEL